MEWSGVLQVSDEGLRFDLNLPRAMTPAEISQVEALVNTWIEVRLSLLSPCSL